MNTPIEDLFALAKEAVMPVVWNQKKACQKFHEAATPELLIQVAEAFRALEQRLLVAEQGEKTFEDGFCSVRQDRDEWKQRAEAAEVDNRNYSELLSYHINRQAIDGFESAPTILFSKLDEWEAYEAMSGCQQAAHLTRLCWAAMLAAAPEVE